MDLDYSLSSPRPREITSHVVIHVVHELTTVNSQVLKAKALEVRDALLESLVSKAREQNNDVISRYEAILSRIAEKPTNEADLAALRAFIADSKEKVRY